MIYVYNPRVFRALFSVILLALGILVFGARPVSGAATEARTGQASAPALPAHRSLSALSPAEETLASPSELDLRNESLLATTEVPGRDIISLTKRLKLRNLSVNIPALVNRSTPNYRVGTSQRFYVANMLQKGY